MPVPEETLDAWSAQGKVTKANRTYTMIRDLIKKNVANTETLLQGSYANETNVRDDDDADVLVMFTERGLNTKNKDDLKYARDFLRETLVTKTFLELKIGNKAVRSERTDEYLRVNMTPCIIYVDGANTGIAVYDHKAQKYVVSFPRQHKKNGDAKDKDTGGNFKKAVRMFKNARDFAVGKGILGKDVCPSHGLEGLLYNVPNEVFAGSLTDVFRNVLMWLHDNKSISRMVKQNGIQPLFGDSPSSWNIMDARTAIDKISYVWGAWDKLQ